MKRLIILTAIIFSFGQLFAKEKYDLIIIGGTPSGIMTAIAAAREGKTSLILERNKHIGGLPANGLGATDLQTRNATTGLFKAFLNTNLEYYKDKYGKDSEQVKLSAGGFHFEPSVAERTFNLMLSQYKDKIEVLTLRQFDVDPKHLIIENDRIRRIIVINRETLQTESYEGKVFIDATYEGDLGAAAKIPFRVGREGKDEFNEIGAGNTYKYWTGPELSSTHLGDNAVQAYNYRLCLTTNPKNRVAIEKPETYNRAEYASLVDDIWTGRHTDMWAVPQELLAENRIHIEKGNKTKLPGDRWGMGKITNMVKLPNDKTDANNQHMSFVSTDLPEENWPWPTSGWDWRDRYAKRLKDYILGLIWFVQNDKELPKQFREETSQWGLAKDEYADNGNFPRQVYVREGRRFEGVYFFTAKDATPVADGLRPPVHHNSIAASHYAFDSHAVRKREPGKINLEGFLSYGSAPYTIPLGVIAANEIDNILFPVPVSGSHIGFSTLRMEPCWMALGEAAGIVASMSIDENSKVKNVDVVKVQHKLIDQQATLIYFEDLTTDHPDFKMVQIMGLQGYFPGWKAELDKPVDKVTAKRWSKLSGLNVKEGEARKTELEKIFLHKKLSR